MSSKILAASAKSLEVQWHRLVFLWGEPRFESPPPLVITIELSKKKKKKKKLAA